MNNKNNNRNTFKRKRQMYFRNYKHLQTSCLLFFIKCQPLLRRTRVGARFFCFWLSMTFRFWVVVVFVLVEIQQSKSSCPLLKCCCCCWSKQWHLFRGHDHATSTHACQDDTRHTVNVVLSKSIWNYLHRN